MNLPNSLTITRIFFVPFLVAVLVQEGIVLDFHGIVISNDVVALIIFWRIYPQTNGVILHKIFCTKIKTFVSVKAVNTIDVN